MEQTTAPADQLVTKRRVIAAFEARLKDNMEAILSSESEIKDSAQDDEEYSSDRLGSKKEEMMDDVEQHDMMAANAKDRLIALSNLDKEQSFDEVDLGALVMTDQANMLVCVALEPIEVDGVTYTGVSLQAPLVQALQRKRAGDSVELNGRTFKIQSIS